MATTHEIHEDIENWLAAAVHDELAPEERAQFEEHLAHCELCRALHEEEFTMSKLIESTLEKAKPDLAFEQRIVSGFRRKVPQRKGVVPLLAHLFRWRGTQITAAAAVLLTLVQIGRVVTRDTSGEELGTEAGQTAPGERDRLTRAKRSDAPAQDLNSRAIAAKAATPQAKSLADAKGNGSAGSVAELRKKQDEQLPVTVYSATVSQSEESNAAVADKARVGEDQAAAFSDDRLAPLKSTMAEPASAPAAEYESVIPPENATQDVNRKLIRNARVELEIIKFDEAVQKITTFANDGRGFIATSSSDRQANGKLRGQVVAKILPENLDSFLSKLRGLGEVKNQTLGTDDVTKQYFDTDSRLKNARVMEQRLIDILQTKSSKVADLLEVEKELGRVRAQIEELQGTLKYMDAQVQFATVTITLAEKDMNVPAAFLLKRRAQLALFSTDVEKSFAEVKAVVDGAKAQISSSTLDRDNSGEATARLVLLIVPEEADALIDRIKSMGRVQNYTEQTDRVAQGGSGMAQDAKVERDKVELSITISRNEQEPALQTTSLRILTSAVSEKVARLKENAAKSGAEIRSSSFSRDPDGQEVASITLRVAMKNYASLLGSFDQLGKVKDVSVQREDRRGVVDEATAPADIGIQIYSQPNIVSDETRLFATIRHTLAQGASALMWSLRMIGVALAFLAPWTLALALLFWVIARVSRARAARRAKEDAAE